MTSDSDETTSATPDDKRLAFEKMADEAGGFYTMTTTVTTAFLGGTLYFCDRFLATGPKWAILPLAMGALLLAASLVMLCWIRWNNVECLRMYLESLKPDGDAILGPMHKAESQNRFLTTSALTLFAVGLLALMIFAIACAWTTSQGAST
jgi:hypothetical protein